MTIPQRTRQLLLAATIGVASLGAYALLIEPRWLKVSHTRIRVPTLPAALTGDFATDYASSFDAVLDILACLDAPLGVYAVPGNHDYRVGIDTWQRQFTAAQGIINLTNQALIRRVDGTRLCIAGVDDFSRGTPRPEVLPPAEQRDFTILLAHNPDQAEHLQGTDDRVDLIVSGHTHGGQVRLPWIGALRNPAHHDDLYEEGLQQRPWAQVYVSRGIGTVSLPVLRELVESWQRAA